MGQVKLHAVGWGWVESPGVWSLNGPFGQSFIFGKLLMGGNENQSGPHLILYLMSKY